MRSTKDRRARQAEPAFPLENSQHELVLADRRKRGERRLENLALEERQLLLSEMPCPVPRKTD